MSLVDTQWEFTQHVGMLIAFAQSRGYLLTFGEAQRPVEMQRIYIKDGRSKTMNSQHLCRLAVDFNVFLPGAEGKNVLCTAAQIAPLGKFWESLNEKNRWGGSWRGLVESGRSKFIDAPHFERQQ